MPSCGLFAQALTRHQPKEVSVANAGRTAMAEGQESSERERGKETPAECQHAGQTRTPRGTNGRRPGQPEAQAVSAGILETVVL